MTSKMTKSEQNELAKFLQNFFKFYFLIKMIPLDRESFKTYFKPSNIILMIDTTCQRLKKHRGSTFKVFYSR
ncbi:MAG: hypothetical protein FD143_3190 [Ignavibacteria bacterium]|nr:MAG: hypothetical protein FD143_3190 [Ignavibacteria bacterium]